MKPFQPFQPFQNPFLSSIVKKIQRLNNYIKTLRTHTQTKKSQNLLASSSVYGSQQFRQVQYRRNMLQAMGLGTTYALMAPKLTWAADNQLIDIRVWPSSDQTRITIETHGELIEQHQFLNNPPRLLIDLNTQASGAQLQALSQKFLPINQHIRQVRMGFLDNQNIRLVFDLKKSIQFKRFNLVPVAAYQHRLIFDITNQDSEDALKMFLGQQNQRVLSTGARANNQEDELEAQLQNILNPKKQYQKNQSAQSSKNMAKLEDELDQLIAQNQTQQTPFNQSSSLRSQPKNLKKRLPIIVIDPGHGGEDPGAIGLNGTYEKTVVLKIARIFAQIASPYARVYLTREDDYFVPLVKRVVKAKAWQADVMISIHADAALNREAKGSSVFALSQSGATSAMARALASSQNSSDSIGGVSDRDLQTQRLLWGMATDVQIRESVRLGQAILKQLSYISHLHKSKVEQAGFAVLKSPDIPSVLVETAFISNPAEEQLLLSYDYNLKIAQAIWNGVAQFLKI
jgi:N-acetylmuramoyl-L-alanine amidase